MKDRTITTPRTGCKTPFGLRMPDSVRQQVEDGARAAGRSMNAEILYRLGSAPGQSADLYKLSAVPLDDLLAELRRRCT